MSGNTVTLFLCGDVMLGRGIDQVLPHPGDPRLREPYQRDAGEYVHLAELANGPVPRPGGFARPWGEALEILDDAAPDARVINLETSVTRSGDFAPGKGVHYRMNPANIDAVAAVRPDVCVLANNHVLDFGRRGLLETLDSLAEAGLRTAGAGRDSGEAQRPAIVPLDGDRRLLVHALAMPTSGVPRDWAAAKDRPGVGFADGPSASAAEAVTGRVREEKRPGDVAVVSVHWGGNWGYDVSDAERRFAHALVDGGVDIVHGHSSHHPRPVETYGGRLVLYGCGDFVDDYEGIIGYEHYRDDLRLAHLVTADTRTGRVTGLRMVPLQAWRMRLRRASPEDTEWLRSVLDGISRGFGTGVDVGADGTLVARPAVPGASARA